MDSKTDDLKSYYRERFNGQLYLDTYFGQGITWWDKLFLQKFQRFFENDKIHGGRYLEIGCGPTIHRSASASLYCDTLVFADISEICRNFLANWKASDSYEKLFEPALRYVAQLEKRQDAKIIEDRIRNKLEDILTCDVLSPAPFGEQPVGLFDVVVSCGCLEGAALTKELFRLAVKNIISVLKPGGTLILAGYHGGTYYYVGDEKLHSLELTIEDVEESLTKAGLAVTECEEMRANADDILVASDCAQTFYSISTKPT